MEVFVTELTREEGEEVGAVVLDAEDCAFVDDAAVAVVTLEDPGSMI